MSSSSRIPATSRLHTPASDMQRRTAPSTSPRRLGPLAHQTPQTTTGSQLIAETTRSLPLAWNDEHHHAAATTSAAVKGVTKAPLKPATPSVGLQQVMAMMRQKLREENLLPQTNQNNNNMMPILPAGTSSRNVAQTPNSTFNAPPHQRSCCSIFEAALQEYRHAKATTSHIPALLQSLKVPSLQERKDHSQRAAQNREDWDARFQAVLFPAVIPQGRDELLTLAKLLDELVGELMPSKVLLEGGDHEEESAASAPGKTELGHNDRPQGNSTVEGIPSSTAVAHANMAIVVDRVLKTKSSSVNDDEPFDAAKFLSQQKALAGILSAGCREVSRQTVAECGDRAVVLEQLRRLFGSLVDNAHRAVKYFSGLYTELSGLRLHETVQVLSEDLTEAQEEIALLKRQLSERDQQILSHSRVTQEVQRLRQWKANAEQVLQEQVRRNGAILKMTSEGTGGIVSGGGGGVGGAGTLLLSAPAAGATPMGRGSTVRLGGMGGRMRSLVSVVKEVMDERRSSIQEAISSKSTTGPFGAMEQSQTSINTSDNATSKPGGGGDFGMSFMRRAPTNGGETVGESEDDEETFPVEMVDAITQTTLDDTVDLQLMGESQSYFEEMDRAAGYTQTLCRIVYGTTDFYAPNEACQNALAILDEITHKAFAVKEAAKESNHGRAATLARRAEGGGVGRAQLTSLLGYYDLPKSRIIKLLQYGITAAREMRLRFQTMTENDSFRRALEWRAPRSALDACKMCQRLGPDEEMSKSQNANLEKQVATQQERIKVLTDERDHVSQLLERSQKRLEFERALSQSRSEELETIARVRRSMLPAITQTDAVSTTPISKRRSLTGGIVVSSGGVRLTPDTESPATDLPSQYVPDIAFPASVTTTADGLLDASQPMGGNSPFPTDWPAVPGHLRSAPPSRERRASLSRRRSSIEVTFDDDRVLERSPAPPPLAIPKVLHQTRSRSASVSDSDGGDLVRGSSSLVLSPGATRRPSDTAMSNASRYRNAFVSLSRKSPPATRGSSTKTSPVELSLQQPSSNNMVDEKQLASVQPKTLGWGLKFITAVYRCKYVPPGSSSAATTPNSRTTSPSENGSCSRHFYDYLRQKFGTRQLIDENALTFLRTLHLYAATDARFGLFARQFADEFPAFVYRHFLTFVNCLDTTLLQFDNSPYAKKGGDDLGEMAVVPLEAILNGIHYVFVAKDRYSDNQELCRDLAQFAINISIVRASSASSTSTRRQSTVQKSIAPPGTEIESSDSFSKYRTFRVPIPPDAVYRDVIRVSFLTKLCETLKLRMYGLSTPQRQSAESTPVSMSPSLGAPM